MDDLELVLAQVSTSMFYLSIKLKVLEVTIQFIPNYAYGSDNQSDEGNMVNTWTEESHDEQFAREERFYYCACAIKNQTLF
jgi:hypothetical protein